MPLVVPGINNVTDDDKTEVWSNKLVGKKLCDDETTSTNFCKKELPETHRIIEPGSIVTKDYRPERLNIHLKEDGTVSHVNHG